MLYCSFVLDPYGYNCFGHTDCSCGFTGMSVIAFAIKVKYLADTVLIIVA